MAFAEGDGEADGGNAAPELRYEQWRLAVLQLMHAGRASSHLACRCLHSLQPYLDFLWDRRMAFSVVRPSTCWIAGERSGHAEIGDVLEHSDAEGGGIARCITQRSANYP